ncbi:MULTISPECIES: hypothetical protein, partial [unclassified Sphingobium]|uniref:hypothetical protein n=1 Tax=unclassified Sphingobium TaxID=2611147 RepID=UPI0035A6BE43
CESQVEKTRSGRERTRTIQLKSFRVSTRVSLRISIKKWRFSKAFGPFSSPLLAPFVLKALIMLGDRPKNGPQRASAAQNCYTVRDTNRPQTLGKPPQMVVRAATQQCYTIGLSDSVSGALSSIIAAVFRMTLAT